MTGRTALTKNSSTFLDIPGCDFSQTGLTISPGLSFNHWERIGDMLRRAESGIQWWIGDWMAYGERSYGETKYAQAVDAATETGINVDTLRYYQHVSEKVAFVRRLTSLSWSHHQVVAPLLPEEQSEWLEKAVAEGYSYRELKREIDRAQRAKNFKLVNAVLEKVWDRIQDGCYTAESISKCNECGSNIFGLELEEIQIYMQQLVGNGKAEWRDQGGKTDVARGQPTKLCVPAGMPFGSDFSSGYEPRVEYGDEGEEHF